jgi:hypothetical protein
METVAKGVGSLAPSVQSRFKKGFAMTAALDTLIE